MTKLPNSREVNFLKYWIQIVGTRRRALSFESSKNRTKYVSIAFSIQSPYPQIFRIYLKVERIWCKFDKTRKFEIFGIQVRRKFWLCMPSPGPLLDRRTIPGVNRRKGDGNLSPGVQDHDIHRWGNYELMHREQLKKSGFFSEKKGKGQYSRCSTRNWHHREIRQTLNVFC